MTTRQIHFHFLEIYGIDWPNLKQDQVDCMLSQIQNMQLLGDAPELRGFVGIQRIEDVVGGFFAIQYENEWEYFDRAKNRKVKRDSPFEKLFFIFFAKSGKLVLQNRKFTDIPLKMQTAERMLREALNEVFKACKVGFTIGFYPPEQEISVDRFVEEFQRSTRVVALSVSDPDPTKISDDMVYYNPQRDRNSIVLESHRHDYPNYKKIDLEASRNGDIKITHIGKDLIGAGKPQVMKYYIEQEEHILRPYAPTEFDFSVDMNASELSLDQFEAALGILRKERSLNLDLPTIKKNEPPQQTFFDILHEDQNDEK